MNLSKGAPLIVDGRYGEIIYVSADGLWCVVEFSQHGVKWTKRYDTRQIQ